MVTRNTRDWSDSTPLKNYAQTATTKAQPSSGWLNQNLGGLNKGFRTITANSPIAGVGLTGLGLGALGYYAAPWLDRKMKRLFSPAMGGQQAQEEDDEYDYRSPEEIADSRKFWMWGLGGTGALLAAAMNYDASKPWYGFKSYTPMTTTPSTTTPTPPSNNQMTTTARPATGGMQHTASAWNDMTLGQGMTLLEQNHDLTPEMRMQSMMLLNSFNAPPSATVTGNDLVGQAIATGQSAATGLAVGYITARALGLPNPKSTAILGAVTNTLGYGDVAGFRSLRISHAEKT